MECLQTSHLIQRYTNLTLSGLSHKNRSNFLKRCIEEKIIPKSLQKTFFSSDHIFPPHAQHFLEYTSKQLMYQSSHKLTEARRIKTFLRSVRHINSTTEYSIKNHITRNNTAQILNLEKKLSTLCSSSKWCTLSRPELINNLSNHTLTTTQLEALGFGLKFATGLPHHSMTDLITKNYRFNDTDFRKGFIQGIIAITSHNIPETTIPKRYIEALKQLHHKKTLIITPSDKGGGIVIMNTQDYNNKMMDLISDNNVYSETTLPKIEKDTKTFNKKMKKLLVGKQKSWIKLINYHPKIPSLYGLPKTHKPLIPMRPIISGIGSAPHKIAREIAKILTPLLGTISPTHIKNSGDLLHKLTNIDIQNKRLASLDIKSLYTNIPVKKCLELLKKHLSSNKELQLPIPPNRLIKLCELCTNLCFFTYNNRYYTQKFGLPMGSPLSGVLACLFLELLEAGPFQRIIPSDSHYFRYIDDVLFIYPDNHNLADITHELNSVEPTIEFTHEEEVNYTLPFLDINLHRSEAALNFSVYRKTTNKDDLIHYYSHHTTKTKTGIIIGFYLRALRICSPQYLQPELDYIRNVFLKLHYPFSLIDQARNQAQKIHQRTKVHKTKISHTRYITVPTNSLSLTIAENLKDPNIKIATCSSKSIKNILKSPISAPSTNDTPGCIYAIPCSKCNDVYIGETSRLLKCRIDEHKRALINNDLSNALTLHRNAQSHNFDFENTKTLKHANDLKKRRTIESACIAHFKTIPQRPGHLNLDKNISYNILKEHNLIQHIKSFGSRLKDESVDAT